MKIFIGKLKTLMEDHFLCAKDWECSVLYDIKQLINQTETAMKLPDPQIFDNAADLIEERGWWSARAIVDPSMWPPYGGDTYCIVAAVRKMSPRSRWDDSIKVLERYFAYIPNGIQGIQNLNDVQPSYEEGKAWAIGHLRKMAEEIREGLLVI